MFLITGQFFFFAKTKSGCKKKGTVISISFIHSHLPITTGIGKKTGSKCP